MITDPQHVTAPVLKVSDDGTLGAEKHLEAHFDAVRYAATAGPHRARLNATFPHHGQ
jgi:hypothetical protein